MNSPDDYSAELRRLDSAGRLSGADEAFLEQALSSKWHGVQAVAARVLARHASPRAVPVLRAWLERHRGDAQLRRVAQRALAPLVTQADVPWVLEEYFADRENAVTLLIAVCFRFPEPAIAERLAADARRGETWSTVVLGAVAFPNRDALFAALLADPSVHDRAFMRRCQDWGTLPRERTLLADD